MHRKYDVVISGAGPAGALLAYHLARSGLGVVILEKSHFPRAKACGGGVTPKTRELLPFPIDAAIEDTIVRGVIRYREPLEFAWPEPVCYLVTRRRFDHLLLTEAARAGAEVHHGVRVTGAAVHPDGVCVRTTAGDWWGELVAAADGANSRLARMVHPRQKRGFAIACRVVPAPERLAAQRGTLGIDLSAAPGGYGWIFPKKDHLNVGIGTVYEGVRPLKPYLDAYLAREGLAQETVVRVQGHPLPFEALAGGRVAAERMILLGDAGGLVDAFTGEGIYYACLSATLAADAVLARRGRLAGAADVYQGLIREVLKELRLAYYWGRVFYRYRDCAMRFLGRRPVLARELWYILFQGRYRDIWSCLGKYITRRFRAG